MRYVVGILAGIVLLCMGYSAYWVWLARGMEQGIERWAVENRAQGYAVDYGRVDLSGFPFSIKGTISAPHIGRPGRPLAWNWSGDALQFESAPWRPDRFELSFAGRHHFSYLHDGQRRVATAAVGSGKAELVFGRSGLAFLNVALSDVKILAEELPTPIRIQKLIASGRPDTVGGEQKLAVSVDAEGVVLPPEFAGPLGPQVALLNLTGTIQGKLPKTLAKEAVARWRDDGGVIDVHQLQLDWGDLASRSRGTVALDEAMRPVGSFTSQIAGFRAVVDALVKTGRIKAKNAGTIKAVLGILARADSTGREILNVAVTAQNGRLAIGPVPVLALLPLY